MTLDSTFFRSFSEYQKLKLENVIDLAGRCNYDAAHANHVTNLALGLFDQLSPLHQFGIDEKFYLACAGILHDIGMDSEESKKHHKKALKIILKTPVLQMDQIERLIVGSIARYHRKALPSLRHDHFSALPTHLRPLVSMLSAILRISDGLDYSHKNKVCGLKVEINQEQIDFICETRKNSIQKEIHSAEAKSLLLSLLLQKKINFVARST